MRQILCLLAISLSANTYAEVLTPAGRLEEATLSNTRFQGIRKERESSTTPSDIEWIKEQNLNNVARLKSVECEQAFLAESVVPKSAYTKTLDLCSKYEVELHNDKLSKRVEVSWASIMRHYFILGLIKTNDTNKALEELKSYDTYVDSNLEVTTDRFKMLEITNAAFAKRMEATRAIAKAVAKKQPKIHSELLVRLKKQEADVTSVLGAQAVIEQHKKLEEIDRHNQLVKEIEDKAREQSSSYAEEVRAQHNKELNDAAAAARNGNANSGDGPGGDCECTRQDPVWVTQSSASGMVKGKRGHYEFKTVQFRCPCK